MIPLADALVDTDALFKVVLYALIAGVGMPAVFSLGILGISRADELRRSGHGRAARAYVALAILAALVVIAGVVEAIVVMTSK
jgi:hypothetical protein